jgi:hypothetical protein
MINNNKSLQRFISLTVTNSTEQCLCWEVKSHTGTQEIFHLSWDPEVHYCMHKNSRLVPILSQMHLIRFLYRVLQICILISYSAY